MAMTWFEKQFVNRRQVAEHNITSLSTRLEQLDISNINDVLEIGSGVGFVSAYLVETYGMNVYGTDFDPDQVTTARELHPESDSLHFGVEDASKLSVTDSSFDLVLSQNVFHHIPDWKRVVREVRRVLRPEGYLIWYDLVFPKFVKRLFQPCCIHLMISKASSLIMDLWNSSMSASLTVPLLITTMCCRRIENGC